MDFDTKDFDKKSKDLMDKFLKASMKGLSDIANEILRLSTFEVPHDKGLLQGSGHVVAGDEEYIVGYNKVYAARLHEHPEYRFQNGRKGKYLEDPIKNNVAIFIGHYKEAVGGLFK